MFHIKPQTEGRGKNKREVLCKHITNFIGEKNGEPVTYRLKFPCLKVVIKQDGDGENNEYAITWSNYYGKTGDNPGKFKLKRMELRPITLYERDSTTGRKITHRGRPVVDYVGMASRWGTSFNGARLNYGEEHPRVSTVQWETEAESICAAHKMLSERFGEKISTEVIHLFLSHHVFCEYMNIKQAA